MGRGLTVLEHRPPSKGSPDLLPVVRLIFFIVLCFMVPCFISSEKLVSYDTRLPIIPAPPPLLEPALSPASPISPISIPPLPFPLFLPLTLLPYPLPLPFQFFCTPLNLNRWLRQILWKPRMRSLFALPTIRTESCEVEWA